MKKLLGALSAFMMIAAMLAVPVSADEITVTLNGQRLSFDQPPVMINDRTMVPLRSIFEALGYDVEWNEAANAATASKGDHKICLSDKSWHISCTNGAYYCDTKPQMINGRYLIPARAVSECAGCTVEWDEQNQNVIITSGEIGNVGKISDLMADAVPVKTDFADSKQTYEDACGDILAQLAVKCGKESSDYYEEYERAYIDADNDGLEELVMISGVNKAHLGSVVPREISVWKLSGDKIVPLLLKTYTEQGRSNIGDCYFISRNGKNYAVSIEASNGGNGTTVVTQEIFEYTGGGWRSVHNILYNPYAGYCFMSGEWSDRDAVYNAIAETEKLAIYDPQQTLAQYSWTMYL